MAKIGILSCGRIKNDLSCGSVGCLRAFNGRDVVFKRYKDDNDLALVGLTSCDGCPTLYAPERILNNVKPLVELGEAEIIHIASCMVKMCPFIQKYKSIINIQYPAVEIVMGTDTATESPYDAPILMFKGLLTKNNPDITCAVKELMSKIRSGANS